jgi:hypothetical protein
VRRAVALLLLPFAATAHADPAIDALVASYPDALSGSEGNDLIWKDGTRMPISDGRTRTFDQKLESPDIKDQFAIPYPLGAGAGAKPPAVNEDPGRIRNEAFFKKMYGDCRRNEVTSRLTAVPWMPGHHGGNVMVTSVNGVAAKLAEASRALDALPAGMTPYLVPSAGTYNCRNIAETKRLSEHAFGVAIDIATKFSDYWQWSRTKGGTFAYKNRIPREIVDVFERYGFIWGGKWYHFDTMHFEYRPELIALAKRG